MYEEWIVMFYLMNEGVIVIDNWFIIIIFNEKVK